MTYIWECRRWLAALGGFALLISRTDCGGGSGVGRFGSSRRWDARALIADGSRLSAASGDTIDIWNDRFISALTESQKGGGKEVIPTIFTGSLIARPSSPRPPSAALMAGRYESNPFDEEEVNPFADRKSVPPAYNSRLSPLPHEPAGFFNGGGATVDIPLDSSNDSRKKEKELQAKEAELRRREQVISSL
ncbi:Secretory carrier-associated membrane protein [Platanthera zijinensis]|uniref:Secretory carrier-associated membrane protein n=1 Tax=Platanthera zijinensis TaxID=2320716 RepID=A0AAP0G763_9ASPA